MAQTYHNQKQQSTKDETNVVAVVIILGTMAIMLFGIAYAFLF
jgi:hypothetical protein